MVLEHIRGLIMNDLVLDLSEIYDNCDYITKFNVSNNIIYEQALQHNLVQRIVPVLALINYLSEYMRRRQTKIIKFNFHNYFDSFINKEELDGSDNFILDIAKFFKQNVKSEQEFCETYIASLINCLYDLSLKVNDTTTIASVQKLLVYILQQLNNKINVEIN